MDWNINQKIDLAKGYPELVVWPKVLMVPGDNMAHTWNVQVLDNNIPVDLAGSVVRGYFIRADDSTVLLDGYFSGSTASVTLTQACYEIAGVLRGLMKISADNNVLCVSELYFNVRESITDTIIDPSHIVPSIDELLSKIDEMEQGTRAANSAANAANVAATSASTAAGAANTAAEKANNAAGSIRVAVDAAASAQQSASSAATSAEAAETAATTTLHDRQLAQEANTAAQAAKTSAESASNTAVAKADEASISASTAESANTTAQQAKADAQAAKDAAVTAKETAVSAKNTAVTKAREASKSATAAAQSAQAARQAAESVDGAALKAAVEGKVSKAGDTMTGPLDAPTIMESGVKLSEKYAAKVHEHKASDITNIRDYIRDTFYPIGKIWPSTSPTSPAAIVGGTWEAIESGRFLVAAGGDYAVGSKGGNVNHQHGLSSGAAAININGTGIRACHKSASFTMNAYKNSSSIENFPQGEGTGVALVGTTDSADNRPPFYAVYMWRRIA